MTVIIRLGRTWQNFFLRLFNSSSITTGARRRMSMSMFMGPMPPARNKLTYRPCPSATMLRERGQTRTSKVLHEKHDRFKFDPTIIQYVATYRNWVAKRTQHVVPNNVARC